MFERSQFRHACYRAKNNAVTEKNQPMLDLVEPHLGEGQLWSNFADEWDLLLSNSGEIVIIKPEIDYDFIHSTLLEAALYKRKGLSMDEDFDERGLNIVKIVDTLRLNDLLMPWSDYNRGWGIEVDKELKQIRTKLYNVSESQITVTDELIEASKIETDVNEFVGEEPTVLHLQPVAPEDTAKVKDLTKDLLANTAAVPPVAKRKKK